MRDFALSRNNWSQDGTPITYPCYLSTGAKNSTLPERLHLTSRVTVMRSTGGAGLADFGAALFYRGEVMGPAWTPGTIDFIRRHYGKIPTPHLAVMVRRTERAVRLKAWELGVTIQPRLPRRVVDGIRRLNARGLPDRVVANRLGVSHETVRHCRRARLKLPCNYDIEGKRQSVITQAKRLGIKPGGQLRVLAFRAYARQHGWPEDLRPRAVQILNVLAAEGPKTKLQLAQAIGVRWEGLPSRKVLVSNDPEGSYLANLMRRGLVIAIGRVYSAGYHWQMVYSLALTAKRNSR